jgi:predicted house-cleaning noncanonical NTP pyrophosphatase (MazG superfamily)
LPGFSSLRQNGIHFVGLLFLGLYESKNLMTVFNKLVRDKIPEIITADNAIPVTRKLNEAEYLEELIKKLKEETAEFEDDKNLEELADIQEVINALCVAIGETPKSLEDTRKQKLQKRGGFEKRIFLERTE